MADDFSKPWVAENMAEFKAAIEAAERARWEKLVRGLVEAADEALPPHPDGYLTYAGKPKTDALRAAVRAARAELEEALKSNGMDAYGLSRGDLLRQRREAEDAYSEANHEREELESKLAEAQQRVLELENFAIEENHAIMTLTGIPRAGYSLQEEIRAQLEETRVDLEEAQQRVESLSGHVRRLLGDLSDAERAVEGWKFKGGMGANIAQESRGRFPSMGYMAHRREAEAALSEEPATGSPCCESLVCPWCKAELPQSKPGQQNAEPSDWDFCPACRGSFSFSKPERPATGVEE